MQWQTGFGLFEGRWVSVALIQTLTDAAWTLNQNPSAIGKGRTWSSIICVASRGTHRHFIYLFIHLFETIWAHSHPRMSNSNFVWTDVQSSLLQWMAVNKPFIYHSFHSNMINKTLRQMLFILRLKWQLLPQLPESLRVVVKLFLVCLSVTLSYWLPEVVYIRRC